MTVSWADVDYSITYFSMHPYDLPYFGKNKVLGFMMPHMRHQYVCWDCEKVFYRSNTYRRRCYPCQMQSLRKTGTGKHLKPCSFAVHVSECTSCQGLSDYWKAQKEYREHEV